MSEHETETTPTPPPPPEPRKLFRARDERVIGGVAGGLGRYFNVDPVIFRIAFVGLTLASGVGIILYLGALLFVPAEGEDAAPRRGVVSWIAVVVLGCIALWLFANTFLWFGDGPGPFFFPGPLVFALLLGALVYWLARRRSDGTPRDTGRRLAIAAVVVVTAPILLVASFWAAAAGGGAVVAGLVIAAGAILLVGALSGGFRWLVLPAVLIAIPAGIVAAADLELKGEYGERRETPTSLAEIPAEYDFAAGKLELDLRQVEFSTSERTLNIDMGMGEALLLVPDDVCVITRAHLGAGYLRVHDRHAGGFDVDSRDSAVARLSNVPTLVVDADIGLGALQIVDDPADWDWDRRDHRFGRGFNRDDEDVLAASDACREAA
jgi:phage shock protein PspC (stress-responsive transcriptional regulator)